MEPLSDDAKAMLAFINKYPGIKDYQLIWELHFEKARFQKALEQLRDKDLIEWKLEFRDDKFSNEVRSSFLRFFPRS